MRDLQSNWGEIYDTYAPRIYRYIYHRLGEKSLAEDLTSEVFVRVLQARSNPDNMQAFLYRVAHNLIVDYLRRKLTAFPIGEKVLDEGCDPVQCAEIDMERTRLRRALLRLTPDQQQVIVLKFLEGLSNDEIASVIGKPVGSVKSLQHRGLETLRNLLSAEVRRDWHFGEAAWAK